MEDFLSLLTKYGFGLVAAFGLVTFACFLISVFTKSSVEEAIKGEFAKGIEQYKTKLQAELEDVKTSLGKSETIFTRQLEALTTLRRIHRGILPKKSSPHMDWGDACELIASLLGKHADELDEFLCLHSVALPNDVLQTVETAISIATDGQFDFRQGNPAEPTDNAIDAADKLWETVRVAVGSLQSTVDAQIRRRTLST